MKEISRVEAARIRRTGEAGFYAVWVNPVVVDSRQIYVVECGGRYYLTDPDELKIEFLCLTQVPVPNGKVKAVHNVLVNNEELGRMLTAEAQRLQQLQTVDFGLGVPAYHTDSLKPKEEE